MRNYYKRVLLLREELTAHRRYFHTHAETGMDMPLARAYLLEKLAAYGIEARSCGASGVTAEIGHGVKTLLLRADMDALPMAEESGLDFACPTGKQAHTCGHDFHAAMLLIAAKLLKEDEAVLPGTVRLMFQPAEEIFTGSRDMIEHGILENPRPDAALACHVVPGSTPVGFFMYNSTGTMMSSVDLFTVTVTGKGAHGACPNAAIDPINIGVHIYLALQELIAREADPGAANVLTVGQFTAGSVHNTIPDTAVLKGSLRCDKPLEREKLLRRLWEVSQRVAAVYGGGAVVAMDAKVPPLICNHELTEEFVSYIKELPVPGLTPCSGVTANASEDFAVVAERIPAAFLYFSAGYLDKRGAYPAHNPKVQFNEDVLPLGAACLAHCARRWLETHTMLRMGTP